MTSNSYGLGMLVLVVVVTLAKSFCIVKEDQRLVLVKLGQINQVKGPGLNIVAPYVSTPIVIELETHLPGWKRFSETQIEEKLIAMVRENPDPKLYK